MENNVTKGDYIIKEVRDPDFDYELIASGIPIACIYAQETDRQSEANAKLFADSLRTVQKCNLLPSELLEQNEAMKGLLKTAMKFQWKQKEQDVFKIDPMNEEVFETKKKITYLLNKNK